MNDIKTFSRRTQRQNKALERQQTVDAALQALDDGQPGQTTAGGLRADSRHTESRSSTHTLKENRPPAVQGRNKQNQDVVQYSRRPAPSAKQKEQAVQSQHLLEMKEYFAEVDEFQLAEETPEKTRPHARARTPVAASRETQEPQASLARAPASAPASAERRTAEWVTALSPVLEHDESQSPANTLKMSAAEASPSDTGSDGSTVGPSKPAVQPTPQPHRSARAERKSCYGLSRRASLLVPPQHSLGLQHDESDVNARKQSLAPSMMSRLSNRFSIGNRLARLSTNWGIPDALQRLGLADPSACLHPAQPQQSPIAEEGPEAADQVTDQAAEVTEGTSRASPDAAAAGRAADTDETASGTEGIGVAEQAGGAAEGDSDMAEQAADALDEEPDPQQLAASHMYGSREAVTGPSAASPSTPYLTSPTRQLPQKENQDPHCAKQGLQGAQQLQSHSRHSPNVNRNTQHRVSPALRPLAEAPNAAQLIVPDTPEARPSPEGSSRTGAAVNDVPGAGPDAVCDRQDIAVDTAAAAVEADVAAVSCRLAELELMPLKQLLKLCGQDVEVAELPSMEALIGQFASLAHIKKVGEGTFGEAFKSDQVVFKIVPLEGSLLVNGETQKRSEEILAEVAIALTLSKLRDPISGPEDLQSDNVTEGFVQTHGLGICQGCYARTLVKEWHRWDQLHESENDAVDAFPEDQLYVVFVFADGGADLEHFELRSFEEAQSVLLQTALSLAVAEEACEFEHRDLHWGNLLVRRDSHKTSSCKLRGHDIETSTSGVTVTLIDFTLSRLTAPTGDIAFCNLAADPELFTGPKGDVQADTYRRMKRATKNKWQGHCPVTNCLWMQYLADVILNLKYFPMTAQQKKALRRFRKQALEYQSSAELVWDEFFKGCWLAAP